VECGRLGYCFPVCRNVALLEASSALSAPAPPMRLLSIAGGAAAAPDMALPMPPVAGPNMALPMPPPATPIRRARTGAPETQTAPALRTALQTAALRASSAQARIADLQSEVKAKVQENDRLRTESADRAAVSEALVARLRSESAATAEERDGLRAEVDAATAEAAASVAECESLRSQLGQATRAAASAAAAAPMPPMRQGDRVSCVYDTNGRSVRHFGRVNALAIEVAWSDGERSVLLTRQCRRESGSRRTRAGGSGGGAASESKGAGASKKRAAEQPEELCAICMDSHATDELVRLSCGHAFCAEGLSAWAASRPGANTRRGSCVSCPTCRAPDRLMV
jgi:regulator of replication initiation timing